MILLPYFNMSFVTKEELTETERSNSGFGDSGRF